MYGMVITRFLTQDKLDKIRFFKKIFLFADIGMEVVFKMPFIAFSNTKIEFDTKSRTQRSYNIAKALPTTRRVKCIVKNEFIRAALDKDFETFVVYVVALKVLETAVHSSRVYLLAALQQNKAVTEILPEYTNYAYIFSSNLAMELPKNIGINKHGIKRIEGK